MVKTTVGGSAPVAAGAGGSAPASTRAGVGGSAPASTHRAGAIGTEGTARDRRGRSSGAAGPATGSSGNAGGAAAANAGGPMAAESEAAALLAAIGKLAPAPRTEGKTRAKAATGTAVDDPHSGVSDTGAGE